MNVAAVKYSPTESELLKMLPRAPGTITVSEMAQRYYKQRKKDKPLHANIFIANSLRTLERKMVKNRERPKLQRSPRAGQKEVEFWRG